MPESKLVHSTSFVSPPTSKAAILFASVKRLGCHVILITKEKMLKEDWPRESLDDLIAVPNDAGPPLFIDLAAFHRAQDESRIEWLRSRSLT